eukprot:216354_1
MCRHNTTLTSFFALFYLLFTIGFALKYKGEVCTASNECQSKTGSSSCKCYCVTTSTGVLHEIGGTACVPNALYKCTNPEYKRTNVGKSDVPEGGACKTGAGDTAPIADAREAYENEEDRQFDAYQAYTNLMADFHYDFAVEEARETRAIQRLKGEKQKAMRLKPQEKAMSLRRKREQF